MHLFRGKQQPGARMAVVLDVGSASVGAGLVLLPRMGAPRVLYHTRHDIVFQEELDFERFLAGMLVSLEQALEAIVRNGLPHVSFGKKTVQHIDHVLVSYASPWYVSRTKVITDAAKKPRVLSREYIDKLIAAEEKLLKPDQNFEIIEKQATNIKLNGYTVDNPYGKEAHDITITLSLTAMVRGLREQVEERITKYIHPGRITQHSFALVGFTAAQQLFPDRKNFLLVDVSGEVTDVSLVQDDGLLESVSFPYGTQHLLRALIQNNTLSLNEARSALRLLNSGVLGNNRHKQIQETRNATVQTWRQAFQAGLERFTSVHELPHHVILSVDSDFISSFTKTLMEKSEVGPAFTVQVFNGETLGGYVLFREGAVSDPFLALEAVYLHTLYSY